MLYREVLLYLYNCNYLTHNFTRKYNKKVIL